MMIARMAMIPRRLKIELSVTGFFGLYICKMLEKSPRDFAGEPKCDNCVKALVP